MCEPVAAPETASFGTGCALWLQVVVGGQPQFGQTPLWGSLNRARKELGRSDLRLSAVQAPALARALGVTYAAVGTLRGTGLHLVLTYQLLQVPTGAPAGSAITLKGTQAQIAAVLPEMARTLVKELKRTGGTFPLSTDLSSADLQELGTLRWQTAARTDAQQARLGAMAAHSPVAGLVNLNRAAGGSAPHFRSAAATLLAQAGNNPLVWGVIAKRKNLLLPLNAAQLSALTGRYPQNSTLAEVECFRYQLIQDHTLEMQAAERAVKAAPQNPDGWLILAETASRVAGDERQGRVFDALSPSEAEVLGRLYSLAEAAAQQAVRLDPKYAAAWKQLAEAATFNSHTAVADHALETAYKLSQDKSDVYDWALEMYQPKWNDDPEKLGRFAYLAAADTSLDADEVLNVARELKYSGFPDMRTSLLTGFLTRKRTFLASHPNDGQAHFEMAAVLEGSGNQQDAASEYQRAAVLLPERASLHHCFGQFLERQHSYDAAAVQLREALKIDPDDPEGYYFLSYCQDQMGHSEEAVQDLKTALGLSPAYGKAYGALANQLVEQNKMTEAIADYRAAIRFGDASQSNYANLTNALDRDGQYDQAITTGTAAINLFGQAIVHIYADGSPNIYDNVADAYLHQQEWGRALAMSQAAIDFNDNDPTAHEVLAEAYLGQNRKADAQTEWKKVLTLNSDKEKVIAEKFLKQYP